MRALAVVLLLASVARADPAYEEEIGRWRAEHEAELRSDDGWLTVAGLWWLDEGTSRFGSAPDNEIVLPSGPPVAGTFERRGGKIVVRAAAGVDLRAGGTPVTERELAADITGRPDVLTLGRLSFFVIARNDRRGIRLRDPENPPRKAFAGEVWFPVDPKLRIEARFVPHTGARKLMVPNVLGDVVPMDSPGRAVFRTGGKRVSLDAVTGAPEELFFIFSDATSGKTTYEGGRFLYTPLPRDGVVVLDFNKAESPPCAFTPFATCPLPPRQNRLPVPIRAGEKHR